MGNRLVANLFILQLPDVGNRFDHLAMTKLLKQWAELCIAMETLPLAGSIRDIFVIIGLCLHLCCGLLADDTKKGHHMLKLKEYDLNVDMMPGP